MGKIKTEGRVTLEFEPDLYEISITVRAEGKTSGAAVTAGKKQTEQLLQALQDELGIKPEQMSAESEDVSIPYREDKYCFSRSFVLKIPANNKLREAITNLLVAMDDVSYSIDEKLADENIPKQEALDSAIKCAKEKATQIANSLQCRIIGFEEIGTDGEECSFDFCECEQERSLDNFVQKSLAADLQNPKIKISGEVTVVWLTEPLT